MAARRKQQSRGLKQVVVRFNVEQDAALLEWLAPFANSYDTTKVIRLACYMLAGIEPAEGLLGLLPAIKKQQNGSRRTAQPAPAPPPVHDALADVMQELAALRATVLEQRAQPNGAYSSQETARGNTRSSGPGDAAAIGEVAASSGIDMSRRRRSAPARVASSGGHPSQPADFDPAASTRLLLETIRDFGANLQRGQR